MSFLKSVKMKLVSVLKPVRDVVRNNLLLPFALALGGVSASAMADTSYVPSFVTAEALQPLATSIISVIGIVGGVVIGVLATSIAAKVAIGFIKSFFSRVS